MSEEFGLVIRNENAIAQNVHIDWNKNELMEYVRSTTEKYKGRVYTEDDITHARADRTELNALKDAISASRIRVKKAVMAPYDRFEAEVAEVTALIVEAVQPIDADIKSYEAVQKADKKKQLIQYFNSIIGDLAESVPFEHVFDQRMLNASTSMKKAKEGIESGVQQVRTDLETINTVVTEQYHSFAITNYFQTFKLAESLKLAQRVEQEDKRREARLAAEAEKAAAPAPAPAQNPAPAVEPPKQPEPPQPKVTAPQTSAFANAAAKAVTESEPAEKPKLYAMSFRAIGTREQLIALRQYMTDNHIKFGKVD